MPNLEHVQLLLQGSDRWNRWRLLYPKVRIDCRNADLGRIELSRADLSKVDLSGAYLYKADLSEAHLGKANMNGANLSGADFSKANLSRTSISRAYLNGASFNQANMNRADLSESNLTKASLNEANLQEADLSESTLIKADLIEANLRKADLSGANLREADLREADLRDANLRNADLRNANLRGANLRGADLSEADLSNLMVGESIFALINVHTTKGLSKVVHVSPSQIELHTMQFPQDGSALIFLRGAGVPEEWISFYQTHMMLPVQYYTCFICYASHDEMLARRLHADLQDYGVRCWFAFEDMRVGDKIRSRIDEAIHMQEKLLLLLSRGALASDWVANEVETALEKETRQKRDVLFPIRLDESVMDTPQAWAATLRRTRHIGDFTHWTDPQAYQQAFDRLLRDLKKAEQPHDQETRQ